MNGHLFVNESCRQLGRNEGFETCKALWAVSDAEKALRDLTSAANRVSSVQLSDEDRDTVESIIGRARLVLDLLASILEPDDAS